MRNRIIPVVALVLLLLFAWATHKSTPTSTFPAGPSNESRISRDGAAEPNQQRRREDHENRFPNTSNGQPSDRDDALDHSRRNRPTSAAPGAFGFYLLNLSWSPEFCATHPSAQECIQHTGFILHGLWPQNTDGTYPEHCSDTPPPSNLSAFSDITPDPHLLAHEWTTHGTCSGLSPNAFFTLARRAFHTVTIPPALVHLQAETSARPSEILSQFARANPALPADALALSCGNNRLTAVEVCLDKSLHPLACPNLRSCRANFIRITPP